MWDWLKDRLFASRHSPVATAASGAASPARSGSITVLYATITQSREPIAGTTLEPIAGTPPEPMARTPLDKAAIQRQALRTPNAIALCKSPITPPQATQPTPIVRSAKQKARRNRIIRFASTFAEMSRVEARLLFAIHRTTLRSLATDAPAVVHRDLKRFSLSTRGQQLLRGRPLPPIAKVRTWISDARCRTTPSPSMPANPR